MGAHNSALEYRIAEMPAHSPAGVAVKLRRIHDNIELSHNVWAEDLIATALEALERLNAA